MQFLGPFEPYFWWKNSATLSNSSFHVELLWSNDTDFKVLWWTQNHHIFPEYDEVSLHVHCATCTEEIQFWFWTLLIPLGTMTRFFHPLQYFTLQTGNWATGESARTMLMQRTKSRLVVYVYPICETQAEGSHFNYTLASPPHPISQYREKCLPFFF